jgi:hypothetical protein
MTQFTAIGALLILGTVVGGGRVRSAAITSSGKTGQTTLRGLSQSDAFALARSTTAPYPSVARKLLT